MDECEICGSEHHTTATCDEFEDAEVDDDPNTATA